MCKTWGFTDYSTLPFPEACSPFLIFAGSERSRLAARISLNFSAGVAVSVSVAIFAKSGLLLGASACAWNHFN